uniref:Uncharacterized protein n=1 Tax=Daphnia galeata TaxID=27404 RepID=A0A8J2RVM5_9CRUS|nr:unnamed protein product [Daphnia galeata]
MNCKLRQCCCGCSLQTGTKIIVIFSLIVLIGVIIQISLIISTHGKNSKYEKEIRNFYLCIGRIIGSVVSVLTIFAALFAAWKNRLQQLILPWLVLLFLSIFTEFFFSLYSGIEAVQASRFDVGIIHITIACIGAALGFYFWLVAFNYYQELKAKDEMEQHQPYEKIAVQSYC